MAWQSATYIAAFVATASDVREGAAAPEGRDEGDLAGLPTDPAAKILVCIAIASDEHGAARYFATWLAEDVNEGGVIAVFDDDDLAAAAEAAG